MTVELTRLNTFEGGTAGANITSSNSGSASGDAFSFVLYNNASVGTAGNAAITYAASAAALGSLGCHFASSGTSATYLRWDLSGVGPYAFVSARIKAQPAAPTATVGVLELRSASLPGAYLIVRTDNTVRVSDRTNASIAASASPALAPGNSYTFELSAKPGTTTTDGYLAMRIYNADGSLFHSWSSSTVNAGVDAIAQARINAPLSTVGWASGLDIDNTQARLASASTDWLGHYDPPVPPDAVASVAPATAIINASGSTADDGHALSYAIALQSGPPDAGTPTAMSASSWWVPQHADADTVYRITVTDTVNALTDFIDVTVPKAAVEAAVMPTLRYFDGAEIRTI